MITSPCQLDTWSPLDADSSADGRAGTRKMCRCIQVDRWSFLMCEKLFGDLFAKAEERD